MQGVKDGRVKAREVRGIGPYNDDEIDEKKKKTKKMKMERIRDQKALGKTLPQWKSQEAKT